MIEAAVMTATATARRAHRYEVSWPVRVRRVNEENWQPAHTLNLSVSGVLLKTQRRYRVGERIELEIEFPHASSIIAGVGRVVREDRFLPGRTAIQFTTEAELTRKGL
jgi:hypothetical protein